MISAERTSYWIRPDYSAAYPSLEAAQKGLKGEAPETDTITLQRFDLTQEEARPLRGLLTNQEGRIDRSVPKRLLDGLCGIGSACGGILALGGAVASFGTLLGALVLAPGFFELSGELIGQSANQIGRAISGSSGAATLPAQQNARDALEKRTADGQSQLSLNGQEWNLR